LHTHVLTLQSLVNSSNPILNLVIVILFDAHNFSLPDLESALPDTAPQIYDQSAGYQSNLNLPTTQFNTCILSHTYRFCCLNDSQLLDQQIND